MPATGRFEAPLSAEAMTRVMTKIMTGLASPAMIKEFLTTLARRGETAHELAAAVHVLRAHALQVPLPPGAYGDTCGTGGDGQGTINVSTAAALVAAAAGVRIVKHGNRAASSRCGSADVLEALGVNINASPEQVARCVQATGFGFCFAPRFHPAMKAVAPVRKELKIRTIFNLIGPLANPVQLTFQLVGVSEARLMRPVAEALIQLSVRHGFVVHGADGLDEISTTGPTEALEVRDRDLLRQTLDPRALGVARASMDALWGGDAAQNARILRDVLGGVRSPARDIIAVNAGCVIYAADAAATITEGIGTASDALAAGRALAVLERVKELSHDAG